MDTWRLYLDMILLKSQAVVNLFPVLKFKCYPQLDYDVKVTSQLSETEVSYIWKRRLKQSISPTPYGPSSLDIHNVVKSENS